MWATSYHIVYKSGENLEDSVKAELMAVDNSLSAFNPASLLSAINSNATDSTDSMFAEIFLASQEVNRRSHGAFDPTVGPLSDLWGFGKFEIEALPDSATLSKTLKLIGINDCHISSDGRIIKKDPATEFDFSAIAKGYGADRVARMLERNGVEDYMVEIGGEIVLRGYNPKGKPWRIQIDAPVDVDSTSELHTRLTIMEFGPSPVAMATSGNYRNYCKDTEGNKYGHTLDPRTGMPVQTALLSATVTAPTCLQADAIATACMVLEPDSAYRFLLDYGSPVEAMLVMADTTISANKYMIKTTPGFNPSKHL